MVRCVECGTNIDPKQRTIIDCPACGIELEITENNVIGLQLGPSEE